MIFFFSTLSIFQCYILPGLLITKNINQTIIFKTVSIIITSIIFNFIIISLLLYLNFYIKEILYFIFTSEVLLIYHLYKNKKFSLALNFNQQSLVKIFVTLLIIFALFKNTGNVIYAWDALISYNEWAIIFSEGFYPDGMVRPYLIPKLWSLIYVFSDYNNITLFTKFTTFIFPSLILLMCLDEILFYKKLRDIIKLFLFCIFFYIKKNFILTGYVDIPLVTIIYCFFYFYRRKNINLANISILIGLTIKLSSLFLMLFFIVNNRQHALKKLLITLFAVSYIFFLYYARLDIFFSNEIFNEIGQNDNFNFIHKLKNSTKILYDKNLIYFLIPSFFGFFLNNFTKKILIFYVIPGLLYWVSMLSYDDRNFLFIIPGLILINSIILEKFIVKFLPDFITFKFTKKKILFDRFKIKFKLFFFSIFALSLSLILISDNFVINFDKLKKNEMIGNKIMTIKLDQLINDNKINQNNFITDYQPIFYIPKYKKYFNLDNNYIVTNIKDLEEFDYYLVYGQPHQLRETIKKKINANKSYIIKNINGFLLVGPS